MLEKNEYFDTKVIDYTHTGMGICKINNFPIFIKGVLVGEKIKIKIIKLEKKFGFGKLIEIYEKSPNRVEPKCPIYNECGGCNIQHLNDKEQLFFKESIVKNVYQKQKINVKINKTLGAENNWFYRNKVLLPFVKEDNLIKTGFYKERTHEVIVNDTCYIQENILNDIVKVVERELNKYDFTIYDEDQHKGNLRHLLLRYGKYTNEVMVGFICNEKNITELRKISQILMKEFSEIKSIILNVNDRKTNAVMGYKNIILSGTDHIYDYIDENKYKISPNSFFQINPPQIKNLYNKTFELANLRNDDIVFDLYCGVGTIGMHIAKNVKKVYGVEIVKPAIDNARVNAKINNIQNIEFMLGAAEDVIVKLYNKRIKPNVVILDPPRKGCDLKLLKTLLDYNVKKIVYISCNPATQARDVDFLIKNGYNIREVTPIDMFSQTYHVETVTILEKR